MAFRRRIAVALIMFVAACAFFTGLPWGQPSRSPDPYLFGSHAIWSGQQIMQLAGDRPDDPHLGANVPTHVFDVRNEPIVINQTDAQRAQIIRRYRLYSEQPDENTLLMALAKIKPAHGQFDPKFYQYGGLFMYPVGIVLKLAATFHYLKLNPDVGFYVDHPEDFGRFYVAARILPAILGVIGIWPVFWIARRFTGGILIPSAAALAYVFLPVVVNGAHEAKPHVQSAVLMLFAVAAATRYVETGRRSFLIGTGVLCGAAFGSVLSALLGFIIIPVMAILRDRRWPTRFRVTLTTTLIAVAVYFLTNPFVLINLFKDRAVLRSNLTNSTDMYHVGGLSSGIPNAARLLFAGATPGLALAGLAAAVGGLSIAIRRRREKAPPGGRVALAILLAAPSLLVLLQFFLLAAGKPAEYGRFALFPDVALAIAAIAGVSSFVRSRPVAAFVLGALLATTVTAGGRYVLSFSRDTLPMTTRQQAAERIDQLAGDRPLTIALWAEPAPYSVPPLDLFRHRLLLLPPDYEPSTSNRIADVYVRTEDAPDHFVARWQGHFERFVIQTARPTPLSWSNKPIVIYTPRIFVKTSKPTTDRNPPTTYP
jgi:hypothetical protein